MLEMAASMKFCEDAEILVFGGGGRVMNHVSSVNDHLSATWELIIDIKILPDGPDCLQGFGAIHVQRGVLGQSRGPSPGGAAAN